MLLLLFIQLIVIYLYSTKNIEIMYSIKYFEQKTNSIQEKTFDDFFIALDYGKKNIENFKCEMINEIKQ